MDSSTSKPSNPVLIGIDWGSSNLRAALLDDQGQLIDRRESSDGVFAIKEGAFGAALWRLCGDWIAEHPVPVLACGMIGSKQGVLEVPYVACPADIHALAQHLGCVSLPGPSGTAGASAVDLLIVPGLKTGSDASGWDVVRGEETQLCGVPPVAGSLHVLPGTHSKWMTQGPGGRMDGFQTYMTGELFDLLCKHSSLGRVMPQAMTQMQTQTRTQTPESPVAFQQGVDEARNADLENLLFRVRTAGLMARLPADALADYLSGMLIGAEVKAGLRRFSQRDALQPISLLGSAKLTPRYAIAMASFGLRVNEVAGDAVFGGLMAVARAAGWLSPSVPRSVPRSVPQSVPRSSTPI